MGNQVQTTRRAFASTCVLILVGCLITLVSLGWWTTPTQARPVTAGTIPSGCTGKTILFVGSTRPLAAIDQPLADYLVSVGDTVIVKTDKEVRASDAQNTDLVIISESVLSTNINTKLRRITVPIVTWEGWLFDDLQMTGPIEGTLYGETLTDTQVRIVKPTNQLAAGLQGDVQTITVNDGVNNKFHWGVPGPNATIVATALNDPTHAYIFAYDQGMPMVGLIAPARRVAIQNATAPYLTSAGWSIFQAAVKWALNCTNSPLPPTATSTPTPLTPLPPSATATPSATPPPGATATATSAHTPTSTVTASPEATIEPTTTGTATPTATATPLPPESAHLTVTKTDFLFNDADRNNLVSANDTLLYVITLVNDGQSTASNVHVTDAFGDGTTLVVGSVKTALGVVNQGNQPGDRNVEVTIDALAPAAQVNISLQATINAQVNDTQVQNQAIASYTTVGNPASGQTVTLSDDPATDDGLDSTVTPLGDNSPRPQVKLFLPVITH